jgi:predicted Zn-dependent protease
LQSEGAITLFDKLIQASRLNDSGQYPYLRSHPMSTERMADMAARAQQLGLQPAAGSMDLVHAMMSARARTLTDKSPDAQRKLMLDASEKSLSSPSLNADWVGSIYAGVVANMSARQYGQAAKLLGILRTALKGRAVEQDILGWLGAELAMAQGQASEAVGLLETISFSASTTRAHRMLRAQALIATQQADPGRQALGVLDAWLSSHPRDGHAWELNGQALDLAQEPLRSLRAQAEARAVRFDYVAAIDRLMAAQDLAKKWVQQGKLSRAQEIDASIIDTRLRQLRLLRREQTLQR